MKPLFLAGRVILGSFFLHSGINHFKQKEALTQYAAAKGLPYPEAGVLASGALLAAGGASLILGLKPRIGVLSLAGFLGAASAIFHNFWEEQDPQAKQNELIHFSKNIALLGAALALAGVEDWPLSIEK